MSACKRCSECQDGPHHWIPNDEEGPDYACKHCDATSWCCISCDEAVSSPDTECNVCSEPERPDNDDCGGCEACDRAFGPMRRPPSTRGGPEGG